MMHNPSNQNRGLVSYIPFTQARKDRLADQAEQAKMAERRVMEKRMTRLENHLKMSTAKFEKQLGVLDKEQQSILAQAQNAPSVAMQKLCRDRLAGNIAQSNRIVSGCTRNDAALRKLLAIRDQADIVDVSDDLKELFNSIANSKGARRQDQTIDEAFGDALSAMESSEQINSDITAEDEAQADNMLQARIQIGEKNRLSRMDETICRMDQQIRSAESR